MTGGDSTSVNIKYSANGPESITYQRMATGVRFTFDVVNDTAKLTTYRCETHDAEDVYFENRVLLQVADTVADLPFINRVEIGDEDVDGVFVYE